MQIFQIFKMSIYLIHSAKFDRNQFRVMVDWLDFIPRCVFHSRWFCRNREDIRKIMTLLIQSCLVLLLSKYWYLYDMISKEMLCSICMFIKHIALLSVFFSFHLLIIPLRRFLSFFLSFVFIPIRFKSFYFNGNDIWAMFHGML